MPHQVTDLSIETLERLLQLWDATERKDFTWSEADRDEDGLYVHECACLGDTLIQMGGHWEGHRNDTAYVELAAKLAPTLARLLLERMKAEEWISVETELPAVKQLVLVYDDGQKRVAISERLIYGDAINSNDTYWSHGGANWQVNFWRPLPAPPSTLEQTKGRK